MNQINSPVRILYKKLCDLIGKDDLTVNLNDDANYKNLKGNDEAKFCEWAYQKIHKMEFSAGLVKHTLNRCDVNKLAREIYYEEQPYTDTADYLRLVLKQYGINEPDYPKPIVNGFIEIEKYSRDIEAFISNEENSNTNETSANPVPSKCRRAVERLLKIIAVFLSDAEQADLILDVWNNNRHGFMQNRRLGSVKELRDCVILNKADIAVLNYLLRACSKMLEETDRQLICMRRGDELWSKDVFSAFKDLSEALNAEVHDRGEESKDKFRKQLGCLKKIIKMKQEEEFRIPGVVQFSRMYQDGHKVMHYEGYTAEKHHLQFYETGPFELHKPYLFLACTNPHNVDVVCVEVNDMFNKPI